MSTLIIAVIAGLAPTLAIVVSHILSTRKVTVVKDETAANAEKLDYNAHKLDNIHVLVNGRLSEALDRIKHLEEALEIEPDAPIPEKGNDESS